jgi:DNA helicase II / ATP-dependent DNA helicase PcrA
MAVNNYDFGTMQAGLHSEYFEEKIHLDGTVHKLNEKLEVVNDEVSRDDQKLKKLRKEYDSESNRDKFLIGRLYNKNLEKLEVLKKQVDSPYFGRIDFKDSLESSYRSYYIGKLGFDEDSKFGVIDWRNPFSEVFYQCHNGEASYEVRGVSRTGKVSLKRQFTIEKSRLIQYSDDVVGDTIAKKLIDIKEQEKSKLRDANIKKIETVDTSQYDKDFKVTTTNEMFTGILNRNADKRLKDIIQTIREEQDKIIRQPYNKTLIVQGVAGSGKSTVGLHRISYILYNNRNLNFKPEEILVVAPNRIFLDYISELLPEIDAHGVKQMTFEEIACKLLGKELKIGNDEKIDFLCTTGNNSLSIFLKEAISTISKFKGSSQFKDSLKLYLEQIIGYLASNTISEINLLSGKIKITKEEQLKIVKSDTPYNLKITQLREYINSKIRVFFEQRNFFASQQLSESEKVKVTAYINSYFSNKRMLDVFDVYKKFFTSDSTKRKFLNEKYFSFIAEHSQRLLSQNTYEREDLAAICYLNKLINGHTNNLSFRHIFIDEAQDLSPFEFIILKDICLNNSLTIMGDINQGINSHRGINDWKELTDDIFKEFKPEYFDMMNSYRSTLEIIQFSNYLIPDNLPKAIPVERHSDKPLIHKISSQADGVIQVKRYLDELRRKGCKSIGIIAKKLDDCKVIAAQLKKEGIKDFKYLDGTSKSYTGGITVLPIVLAKGLEFDAVILWDASSKNFTNNDFDKKLLYVAVTRPLKYLCILYRGKISQLLDFAIE